MADRFSLYLDNDLNRVFNQALVELAATELKIVTDRLLDQPVEGLERAQQGRCAVLEFECSAPVEQVQFVVGRLSASAMLFRHRRTDDSLLLEPLPLHEHLTYGTELVTIQRYRGKTNERLTRAMLNIALAAAHRSGTDPSATTTVLDPLCGRGTTLNWALVYGLQGIGIEPDRAALDQHAIFLETWAKRSRLPHKSNRFRDGNAEQRFATLDVAPYRKALKDGTGQKITTFRADGGDASLPIKKATVDTIVTDLPYGIQHRGQSQEAFDPLAFLDRVLPVWTRWLRSRGSLCLAWNLKQVDRDAVNVTLRRHGFEPVVAAGGFTMRHVVDSTVDRDVICAVKSS